MMVAWYPVLAIGLVLVALVARLAIGSLARRRGHRIRVLPSIVTGAVLVALTIVFDNLMIAVGLFSYAPEHLSGIMIGLAPIEDLSYPVAAALLLPALWHALARDDAHD